MDKIKEFKNNKYRIKHTYPNSGQKDVYRVENIESREIFIMKILKFREIKEIERVFRETEVMQKINSEYFAKIYDKDLDFTNKEFVILEEYIEGDTLKEKLLEYKGNEEKCIKFFTQVILGMSILWEKDIIHRDLKPENIMVRPNGKPVILDLGIIKCLNESSLTLTGEKMPYTSRYCTPEQYRNETNSISQRTDFFILGIVLAEMYLGEHIFMDENGEIDILGEYKETNNLKIDKLLKKILAKEPFNRYRTEVLILNHLKKEWGGIL